MSADQDRKLGAWTVLFIVIGAYYVFYSFFGVTPKYWMNKLEHQYAVRLEPPAATGQLPVLGIEVDKKVDDKKQGKGVKILRIKPDSPAARAGLRAGDVIATAAGSKLSDHRDLDAALRGKKAWDLFTLTVKRRRMQGMAFSYHSTVGGMMLAMMIVFAMGWHRRLRDKNPRRIWGGMVCADSAYTLPSGICTAVVIFTTVVMYTLGPVVVAMIIMRGSLLVIGRLVDVILQQMGVRKQVVYWQSTFAVLLGLGAVLTIAWMAWAKGGGLLAKPAAIVTMALYIGSYAARQFIMAWYKESNKGKAYDMPAFFGAEQYWAFVSTLLFGLVVFTAVGLGGWGNEYAVQAYDAFRNTDGMAVLSCLPYGGIAFVSVFIFMFEAGSATFNVAINRFTSLMAGFTATVVAYKWLNARWLYNYEQYALGFLIAGFAFLFWAAFRRKKEDAAARAAAAV